MAFLSRLILLLLVTSSLLTVAVPAATAQQIEVIQTEVTYAFGGQVTFWAQVVLPEEPEEALVFYRSKGEQYTLSGILSVIDDQVSFVHDLTRSPLRAFSEVEYWFGFRLPGGANFISETYSFLYDDNRFQWRQVRSDPIVVNWYDGDLAFGQMALDTAKTSLDKAQAWFDYPELARLRVYIYASAAEMQSTLQLGGISMIGGHTSPDLGVVIVSLPVGPEQQAEIERQIPHEIMHILLYQKLGDGYVFLPTWLNEGLASKNEFFPNPDYHVILSDAVERQVLLPMNALCKGFPLDASSFFLSYAQSESFVGYLYDQYGRSGVESLMAQYADGVDCERGAQLALGVPLSELDASWRQAKFDTPAEPWFRADHPLLSWLALAVLILIVPLAAIFSQLSRTAKPDDAAAGEVLHE